MKPSIILLGEQNWDQWRTYIRGRLLTKGLWYVMDVTKSGDRRVGESTEAAKTRLQTDMDKAYGIIIEGIEPSQYQYVEDAVTAIAAYKALSDHHKPKSKIDKLALSSELPPVARMLDCVHIDEKWFYITQVNRRFYLWHDEPPQRKAQSKRHITKIMFLCAVARPRHDSAHRKIWDGKVGLWPFVETQLAKRRSKNRDRGTPVTVLMTVTKPVSPWCVEDAFENLAWRVLDKTFMTLQKVMEEAMRSSGDNVYKLPHLKKDIQFKTGVTELRPSCDEDVLLAIESMENRLKDEQRR
ncbi:hypothetical protein H257_03846 [Aphanomyces astaci]|uniref:DUF4219 domain-containing protein n=1 Tax=Aphanomyces astaci TaxID=112090 RepID=W4GZI2_APHAT|nr:hypothetical protein H257_03846 [Aphanomyces astaci]ETV84741.1 hypothetical protein H257_03846 [Aphanomyces astaci]|eukprot:XP_009826433.1 hypothetical protein H257_03846 [Aphanomyces astaci]